MFNEIIVQLRSNLSLGNFVQFESSSGLMLWNDFQPVSFESCKDIFELLKSTSSLQDIIPPRFLKRIFNTVGHDLVSLLDLSLTIGVVAGELCGAMEHSVEMVSIIFNK